MNSILSTPSSKTARARARGFSLLEMIIVVGIIGFLAAMALPHLKGFTQSNSVSAALRQIQDDVTLARQRAIVNRTKVYIVFGNPVLQGGGNYWASIAGQNVWNPQLSNLYSRQYTSYAMVCLRSVGDQPGRMTAHYLTDWKYLPQGVFFTPFQLTNNGGYYVVNTTNTLTGITNPFAVSALSNDLVFPFPSTLAPTGASNAYLPYFCFLPNGQLQATNDLVLSLTRGSIFYPLDANGAPAPAGTTLDMVETPPGNESNDPVLVHIDYATGRAKTERNQF